MSNQKRISSKVKQKQIQTKYLEQQTKKMQDKLIQLKKQIQEQKKLKNQQNSQSTLSRWKKNTNSNAPLKDYAKKILIEQQQAYQKFGINKKKIINSKSFSPALNKINSQKQQKQQKDPSYIPKIIQQPQILPIQSIQNNFFKAKINTTQLIKQKTLKQFLQQNYLQQYLKLFQQQLSIYTLDDLRYINKQQLQSIGIKVGHQIKILKKIKQEFQTKSIIKQSPKKEKVEEKKQLVQFGYGDGDVYIQDNNNNFKFNQIQNSNQYDQQEKTEEIEDNQQNYDNVEFLTIPMSQICLQADNLQTERCYGCYKKIIDKIISQDERLFCSVQCQSLYLISMQKKCPQCGKYFFKHNGFFQQGYWFCSISCCPNRQKIQQLFIQWNKQNQN